MNYFSFLFKHPNYRDAKNILAFDKEIAKNVLLMYLFIYLSILIQDGHICILLLQFEENLLFYTDSYIPDIVAESLRE